MDGEEFGGVCRRSPGLSGERHVGFFWRAAAFSMVAGTACGGEVFPGVGATAVTGCDVIEREVAATSAVLAAIAIASEDLASGEAELGHGPADEVLEADDGGRFKAHGIDAAEWFVPDFEDFRFSPEHEHDGAFDRANVEWLVVLVQDQRPPLDCHCTSTN